MWDHTAVTADSKLVVSLVVGKRTQEQTKALVHDAKRRLRPGICQRFSPMPMRAMSRPSWQPLVVVTPPPATAGKAGLLVPFSAGPKAWPMVR